MKTLRRGDRFKPAGLDYVLRVERRLSFDDLVECHVEGNSRWAGRMISAEASALLDPTLYKRVT